MGDFPQQNRPRYSALPASAADGDEIVYIADDSNGIEWLLKYRAAETTYKWRAISGPPLSAFVGDNASTLETTASASFVDLATVGPSITLPLNGDYLFTFGFNGDPSAEGIELYMSPKIGGATATAADQVSNRNAQWCNVFRTLKKTGQTSGTVIKMQYASGSGTARFRCRQLMIQPLRVS